MAKQLAYLMKLPRTLLTAGLIYLFASLGHFVHNAEFIDDYPNLPAWSTPSVVYLARVFTALPGLLAWLAWSRGRTALACGLFAVWGALGYLGLDHYYVAAVSAHTQAANFTILFEVMAGTVLLASSVIYLITPAKRRTGADA